MPDDDWIEDLNWSARAFHALIWPLLKRLIGGELVHVEAITKSDFAKRLDQLAGIDAWHIKHDAGIRGIASRVQVCAPKYPPYNTFTIRRARDSGATTEYEKRKAAIESDKGWLFPHLTIQSYISAKTDGELRSFAVAKTEDIITAIDEWIAQGEPEGTTVWSKRTTNASFFIVRWDIVAQYIYNNSNEMGGNGENEQ